MNRLVNLILAVILAILLVPLMLLLAVFIRLDSRGPAIFKQRRVGQHGRHFTIYKFRTMQVDMPDLPSALVPEDDHRFTRVGKIIRRYSLDELPQIYNILKGDMNFIGPRPALYNQDDLIRLRERSGVYALKPGITGWAQVNGRETVSVKEKVRLDKYYLENRSWVLDLKIIFFTVFNSYRGKDLYARTDDNNVFRGM